MPNTNCTQRSFEFPPSRGRLIDANFGGGDITSNAGALLLRQVDRLTKLTDAVSRLIQDRRRQASCDHDVETMLRQRVYAIALGEEDLNDHATLRDDLALQTAVDRDQPLASAPTLCRFENQADRALAWAIHGVLVDQFIASFKSAPKELVLDVDATDDAVHGLQEGRFFHGYYDHYCFLPLYVFCNEQLLVSYLRPSKIDASKHAWAILSRLIKRLRVVWPDVRIVVRGDSGFCRWRMLRWFEDHDVCYVIGIAKNARLEARAATLIRQADVQFAASGEKQRLFGEIRYAARSWDRPRRVIVKAEHTALGSNSRYVVTNLENTPQVVYDVRYCARGEMENRIKEQLQLFADRTSCHRWWPNQFRLMLSSLAYTLLEAIRRLGLKGTELARAQVTSIRLKLLKVGAIVLRNTRRVRLLLSSAYPHQRLFFKVAARLEPG